MQKQCQKPLDSRYYLLSRGLEFVVISRFRSISSKVLLSLYRGELRHRNPIRKPLFMRVCELSVLILPTVCPQEFFAHRLSLHLFYGLIISYFVELCKFLNKFKPVFIYLIEPIEVYHYQTILSSQLACLLLH